MDFNFIYEVDYSRLIPAIVIDSRGQIPEILNMPGSVIKAFADSLVDEIDSSILVYKIETMTGNLAGYFTVKVNPDGSGTRGPSMYLRPAFLQKSTEISAKISNFITNGSYGADHLF